MTKRNLSIVTLLIQTAAIILVFSGDSFYTAWNRFKYFEYFSHLEDGSTLLVGICFMALIILNLIFSIVGIFKQTSSINSKTFLLLPILVMIVCVTSYIYCHEVSHSPYYGLAYSCVGYGSVFSIEIIVLSFNILLEAAKRFINIPYCNSSVHEKISSSAEELGKFKELFDSGAITQEEFEEKKKQILNL